MSTIDLVLAAISWEPEIRGATAVAIGFVVLCGSVFLLLATNSGLRTGFLLAATGLFGWCAIMGVIWWVYGIGWVGTAPSWQTLEINYGDLSEAVTESVSSDPTLSDWTPVPPADSKYGELQAAADAALTDAGVFEPGEYLLLDDGVFTTGGKDERDGDSIVDRVLHRLGSAVQITHPTRYAVVEVQQVIDQGDPEPGQAPPTPEIDASQPVVSVIFVRDLGNERFTPAAFTIFCAVMFGILANVLHRRDKAEADNRARTEPEPAGV